MRLAIIAAAIAFLPNLAIAADSPEVTGNWTMTVETDYGTGNPTFTLAQDGESITGTYKGLFGEAPVAGTIKDGHVTLSIKVNAQGEDMTVEYAGTVEGDAMSGKVMFSNLGEATFKGTRAKQESTANE
jgi:uncharacterized protein with FMN-binding domain